MMGSNDWRHQFENINGYTSNADSGCVMHSELYGDIHISNVGTGKVFVLSGSARFMRRFRKDFLCARRADGSATFDEHIMNEVASWLAEVCGECEIVEVKRRRFATYDKNCKNELARLRAIGYTEVETEVKKRIGQAILREELLKVRKCCEISGIAVPGLLIVSHIKDWCESTDDERLDTENVLILACNWDALFDKFYISFDCVTGKMIKSRRIDVATLGMFGVPADWEETVRVDVTGERRREYLAWHNARMDELDRAAGA